MYVTDTSAKMAQVAKNKCKEIWKKLYCQRFLFSSRAGSLYIAFVGLLNCAVGNDSILLQVLEEFQLSYSMREN